jgi:hypothetical protein
VCRLERAGADHLGHDRDCQVKVLHGAIGAMWRSHGQYTAFHRTAKNGLMETRGDLSDVPDERP